MSSYSRVREIEDALAKALNRGDFTVVVSDGERFLEPILAGHVMEDAVWSRPLLNLHDAARELERLLS